MNKINLKFFKKHVGTKKSDKVTFLEPVFRPLLSCKLSATSSGTQDEYPVDKKSTPKKRAPSVRKPLILTEEQEQIVVGSLLGDMHIEFRGLNCRLKFRHSEKQREYAFWKYEQLKNLVPSEPKIAIDKKKVDGIIVTYNVIWFNSYTNSTFNKYRETWYNSAGEKIIPSNVEDYLTPLSLLILLYDDGTALATSKGFRLALNNFSRFRIIL